MSEWWQAVEQALERLGDDNPDPWAEVVVPDSQSLRDEQRAFLAQLADTPGWQLDHDDLHPGDPTD